MSTSYQNPYWGTLIDAGKNPSPLLEQLCLGLAKIIGDLEPSTSPDNELTPARLAAFYKSCGGDFDEVFYKTGSHGLSYMYKTIGCMHSLQPTTPYETPSIPCLKPAGYLRWQTIQLQLLPAVHTPILQKAVNIYNVPKPDGGTFPKYIPSDAFPAQPDKEIETWWNHVTHSLSQENYTRRLGNSPYRSPHENGNSNRSDYFTQNGRLSASQRPHRQSRPNSEERADEARRRSSVPDLIFNQIMGKRPEAKNKTSRSRSAQRISSGPYHHSSSAHRQSGPTSPYRPSTNGSSDFNGHRKHRSSGGQATPRQRGLSPAGGNDSTGSEGSSEDSRSSEKDDRRRSSLWPPPFSHNHHRRHSHDASYRNPEQAPPLPARPPPLQTQVSRPEANPQSPPSATRKRGVSSVHFRSDMFNHDHALNSAPETPIAPDYIPRQRYEPPPQSMHLLQGAPSSRSFAGENTYEDQNRNFSAPTRSKTVTMGVGGRRYPELPKAGHSSRRKDRTMSAAPIGLSQS